MGRAVSLQEMHSFNASMQASEQAGQMAGQMFNLGSGPGQAAQKMAHANSILSAGKVASALKTAQALKTMEASADMEGKAALFATGEKMEKWDHHTEESAQKSGEIYGAISAGDSIEQMKTYGDAQNAFDLSSFNSRYKHQVNKFSAEALKKLGANAKELAKHTAEMSVTAKADAIQKFAHENGLTFKEASALIVANTGTDGAASHNSSNQNIIAQGGAKEKVQNEGTKGHMEGTQSKTDAEAIEQTNQEQVALYYSQNKYKNPDEFKQKTAELRANANEEWKKYNAADQKVEDAEKTIQARDDAMAKIKSYPKEMASVMKELDAAKEELEGVKGNAPEAAEKRKELESKIDSLSHKRDDIAKGVVGLYRDYSQKNKEAKKAEAALPALKKERDEQKIKADSAEHAASVQEKFYGVEAVNKAVKVARASGENTAVSDSGKESDGGGLNAVETNKELGTTEDIEKTQTLNEDGNGREIVKDVAQKKAAQIMADRNIDNFKVKGLQEQIKTLIGADQDTMKFYSALGAFDEDPQKALGAIMALQNMNSTFMMNGKKVSISQDESGKVRFQMISAEQGIKITAHVSEDATAGLAADGLQHTDIATNSFVATGTGVVKDIRKAVDLVLGKGVAKEATGSFVKDAFKPTGGSGKGATLGGR